MLFMERGHSTERGEWIKLRVETPFQERVQQIKQAYAAETVTAL